MDSRGLGNENDLLPNADTAGFACSRPSLPSAAERATAELPDRQLAALAPGHWRWSRTRSAPAVNSPLPTARHASSRSWCFGRGIPGSRVGGQEPECLAPGQGSNGAEVPLVQRGDLDRAESLTKRD